MSLCSRCRIASQTQTSLTGAAAPHPASERRCITARAGRSNICGRSGTTASSRRNAGGRWRPIVSWSSHRGWRGNGAARQRPARRTHPARPHRAGLARGAIPIRCGEPRAARLCVTAFKRFRMVQCPENPACFLRLGGVLESHPVRRFPLCPSAGARNPGYSDRSVSRRRRGRTPSPGRLRRCLS